MTKKLKDSLHATLHACYNGNNGAEAVKTLMRENKKELYDAHVWNEVACKIQARLKKHNKHAGSNLHIGDSQTLFVALNDLINNDEEAFNKLADDCLTSLK